MIVKEVRCKSLLNKSGLADYCINPYTGCQHGCAYCYARFMKMYTNHKELWGQFVDVKMNAADVLKKELERSRKGSVFVSSVTDAYQLLEKKYELTRKCLYLLLEHDFSVTIQTKSSLVKRDIDIIRKFNNAEVGLTITTMNEQVRQRFEPFSSSVKQKLDVLSLLKQNGIRTYAFIGPFLPILSENVIEIIPKLEVDYIFLDKLNIKCGNWSDIEKTVKQFYPQLLEKWKDILFEKNNYYDEMKQKIMDVCKQQNIECKSVF